MSGPLLHFGATVTCLHGGSAVPASPNPRVTVGGMATATLVAPWMVAGCPFNVGGVPTPCVSAQFVTASLRVSSLGQPLLLLDSQAVIVPNGVPLVPSATQARVVAM